MGDTAPYALFLDNNLFAALLNRGSDGRNDDASPFCDVRGVGYHNDGFPGTNVNLQLLELIFTRQRLARADLAYLEPLVPCVFSDGAWNFTSLASLIATFIFHLTFWTNPFFRSHGE
mmetsp:Transcript_46739/g.109940  ORF Transcript_46739/g.109940 Transcript_46739/m.109940 type:complete len:117 (+) Transcript_46739:165-515(+)